VFVCGIVCGNIFLLVVCMVRVCLLLLLFCLIFWRRCDGYSYERGA
jgi:hypothetical protein